MAVIQLKRSTTPGSVPASLAAGEVAINLVDRLFFYNDNNGNLKFFNATSDAEKVASGAIANAINAKANINSPTFTGTPSGPTPNSTDNSNAFATTAFVKTAVAAVGSGATTAVNRTDYRYVATANQTTFSGTDQNGKTLSYVVGNVWVFYQGALLTPGADYTATSGSSIVLTTLTPQGGEEIVITVLAVAQVPLVVVNQCRLIYTSATAITLIPAGNGNQMFINGALVTVPSAGVALANTGLAASTLYYIYAFLNGSTLTLEASTTGHTTNATYGYEQKSGDATRSLVGMVFTNTSSPGQFVSSPTNRWVASYHNQQPVQATTGTISTSTLSTTYVEATAYRLNYLTWGVRPVTQTFSGLATSAYSGGHSYFTQAGQAQSYIGPEIQQSVVNPNYATNQGYTLASMPTEGAHTANIYSHIDASATTTYLNGQHDVIVWQ